MPIKPEKKKLYPKNWKEIVAWVRNRSDDTCELCGVINHTYICRHKKYPWRRIHGPLIELATQNGYSPRIEIVLTVAHINQDPTDNRPENLLHLCQRCHLRIDLPYRMDHAAKTRGDKKGKKIFEEKKSNE